MWTWNTKQVFLYVFVEYETKKNVGFSLRASACSRRSRSHQAVNQVILWDRIIDDREDAYFDESDIRSEYILADQGYHLKWAFDAKRRRSRTAGASKYRCESAGT